MGSNTFGQGGRALVLRPDNIGRTRAFLCLTIYYKSDERLVKFGKASQAGISAQKAVCQEMFQDAGWEVDRMLKAMHESDNFYMLHVAQVRLDRWSKGRVTVVGDAGYAPSPLTGMGTSLAFIGAYVLAGEISKHSNNVPAALESYVCVLRPYVERIQKLPPGIPWIVNPQSTWCIKVLETVFWGAGLLQNTLIAKLFWKIGEYLPAGNGDFKLPDYEAFKQ